MACQVTISIVGRYRATVRQTKVDGTQLPDVTIHGNYERSPNPGGEMVFNTGHPATSIFEIIEEYVPLDGEADPNAPRAPRDNLKTETAANQDENKRLADEQEARKQEQEQREKDEREAQEKERQRLADEQAETQRKLDEQAERDRQEQEARRKEAERLGAQQNEQAERDRAAREQAQQGQGGQAGTNLDGTAAQDELNRRQNDAAAANKPNEGGTGVTGL